MKLAEKIDHHGPNDNEKFEKLLDFLKVVHGAVIRKKVERILPNGGTRYVNIVFAQYSVDLLVTGMRSDNLGIE